MIVADVRSRLTRDDVALVLSLIAQHGSEARSRSEDTLHERGLDALLDDPALLPALIETPRGGRASLPLFALAAARFPQLRIALNRISDALLFPRHHSPERLMRQVRDEARWRRAG